MIKLLDWLSNNKAINILLLLTYFLLVVLPHEEVGLFINSTFGSLSRPQYNLVMLIVFSVIVLLVFIPLVHRISKHDERKIILFYLTTSLVFATICYLVLFVVNVEAIHFLQYAIFVILCFPLVNNYSESLIWATIAGAVDEGYQFFYLAPERTPHFDWNDIIINLIGAALGLIVLKIFNVQALRKKITMLQSPIFYFLMLVTISFFVLVFTGTLSIYQDPNSPTPLTLVRELPEGFWTYPPGPYVKYHIVEPLEGITVTVLLILFYSRLDH